MIGTHQPKVLGEFYEKVIGKKSDMGEDNGWYGWTTEGFALTIGEHSEVKGKAKEPQRMILNFDTKEIEKEYARIKKIDGAEVIKELYEMEGYKGMWIATFADPDGNYFQLMTPWEG
jgi:predicted enzyme related to lactoylglutathione lyase